MFSGDLNVFINPLGKPMSKNEVVVFLDEQYNRKKLPGDFEADVEAVWKTRMKGNPSLFNGTKFRLDSISQGHNAKLSLCVGVTCYKDFLGTNYSPQAELFKHMGQQDHGNTQAYLSDAIGVGALLVTSDDNVVVIKRSYNVAEDAGKYDRPGGHAEPNELVGNIPLDQIIVDSLSPEAVRNELFNSIIREVRDEVNIPEKCLEDPLLLGAYRNPASAGRPGLEFLVRCSLSSKEVLTLYEQGTQAEADESTAIKFLKITDLKDASQWTDVTFSMKSVMEQFSKLQNL